LKDRLNRLNRLNVRTTRTIHGDTQKRNGKDKRTSQRCEHGDHLQIDGNGAIPAIFLPFPFTLERFERFERFKPSSG